MLDAQNIIVWNCHNADHCGHNRVGHGNDSFAKPAENRRRGDRRFYTDDKRDGSPGSAVRRVLGAVPGHMELLLHVVMAGTSPTMTPNKWLNMTGKRSDH